MKKKKSFDRYLLAAGLLLSVFVFFTAAVSTIDVQAVGPEGSSVGLAGFNQKVFELFGKNLMWYHITDWLGIAAIVTALGFAVLGCIQIAARKSIKKVDADIIALGIFYLIVVIVYIFFELVIVNYRPVLLEGSLEASYPSSHTMMTLCIMVTAMMQFHLRIRKKPLRIWMNMISGIIIGITIIGRLISGVHWATDIIGGILLSVTLTLFYYAVIIRITICGE